jgi:hypothetical protein
MYPLAHVHKLRTAVPAATVAPPRRRLVWVAGAALLITLTLFSSEDLTSQQVACAGLLLTIAIGAYLNWATNRIIRAPIWPLFCAVHFIYYGLAIFSADRISPSRYDQGASMAESTLTRAMLVGVLGLLAVWLGRKAATHLPFYGGIRLRILGMRPHTPFRIYVLLLLGTACNLLGVPLGESALRNIGIVVLLTIPLAAFLWLILASTVRGMSKMDLALASAFFLTRMLSAARGGVSLTTLVVPPLLVGLALVSANRRLPWAILGIAGLLFLFLQPSKGMVREEARLSGGQGGSGMGILLRWIDLAASGWTDALSGKTPLNSQFGAVASRSSLLTLTGVVLEKTPDLVPFQNGSMYPLLLQNMIPRILWSNKPTANEANRFFQVKYGLTDEQDLSDVSIACGFEAEGYMNFGWFGVIAAGLFVGIALKYYECTFFSRNCSFAATALGLSLLPGFLSIESQLVGYLGGILQVVAAATIIFWDTRFQD